MNADKQLERNALVKQEPVSHFEDLSDEDKINSAISKFYDDANSINDDNVDDVIERLKARRKVIINMMQVYLAKFNNKLIVDDFDKALNNAKKDATENEKCYKYDQYLNEIRVVGTFLGIREKISEKLGDQLFDLWERGN